MSSYPCGKYQLSGSYRYGDSNGSPGGSFNYTIDALKVEVVAGLSGDESYFDWYDCSNQRHTGNNNFGGVRSSTFSITQIGPCPCGDSFSDTYDCINGKCTWNKDNLGYFKSLAECEKICAFTCGDGKQCVDPNTFCPPGKVCLDKAEYSEINSIIDRLEQEFCN